MTSGSGAAVEPAAAPSGEGCLECEREGGWWVHLRRCAACGHVGCCDTSPSQHSRRHYAATGHALIRSFEPDEEWFYDFAADDTYNSGPRLADPQHRPRHSSVPGPADRVPADWREHLNR